jgi:hypothetical protein
MHLGRKDEAPPSISSAIDSMGEQLNSIGQTAKAIVERFAPKADAAGKGFWMYEAASETPTLAEAIKAGAIAANTTEAEWNKLTPGMKREIVRSLRKTKADGRS